MKTFSFVTSLVVAVVVVAVSVVGQVLGQDRGITGVIMPIPTRHFRGSPVMDWPVTRIHVRVGDQVKAGGCLIELDPATLPMQEKQGLWDAAKKHVEVVKARLGVRKAMLSRAERLAPVGACSVESQEECREAVEVLQRELEQAEAGERAARAAFGMAKYNHDNYQRINCPIAGEVVAINCSLGLVARAEQGQVVWVEVIDSTRVHVVCVVLPELASVLRGAIGKELRIRDTSCKAKIVAVPRLIRDGKTQVIFEVDNSNSELICGQEVQITPP